MVERCLCKADASGSSPLTSTLIIESLQIFFLVLKKRRSYFKGQSYLTKVKGMKANGGDLGTQRRRRAQIPAKRFGELAASFDPKIPE